MERSGTRSWWTTLPGLLTATAGVITAVTGLLAVLAQNGVLGEKSRDFINRQTTVAGNPMATSKADAPIPTEPSTVANSEQVASQSRAGTPTERHPETGVTTSELSPKPFTGALLTLSDGSIVKLRDDIQEAPYGAQLHTVQGQSINFDLIKRFDVVDWTLRDQKGKVKITLNNGEVFEATVEAWNMVGRNDLGDVSTGFDKIRSVEFIR